MSNFLTNIFSYWIYLNRKNSWFALKSQKFTSFYLKFWRKSNVFSTILISTKILIPRSNLEKECVLLQFLCLRLSNWLRWLYLTYLQRVYWNNRKKSIAPGDSITNGLMECSWVTNDRAPVRFVRTIVVANGLWSCIQPCYMLTLLFYALLLDYLSLFSGAISPIITLVIRYYFPKNKQTRYFWPLLQLWYFSENPKFSVFLIDVLIIYNRNCCRC